MKPSKFQQDVLDWCSKGDGNAVCQAVPGSGKSTTLKLAALALERSGYEVEDIRLVVFGKANSVDLERKLGSKWKSSISTLNSAGWRMIRSHLGIRRADLNSAKYKKIAQERGFVYFRGQKGTLNAHCKDSVFLRVVDLLRLTLTPATVSGVKYIVEHFTLDIEDVSIKMVADAAATLLKDGERQAINEHVFDFSDQVWLPNLWQLEPRRPSKFVMVDECQDLNAAQTGVALKLAGSSGRVLGVGDRSQAIFGFAGAKHDSFERLQEALKAQVLPLSICYRCPTRHIDLLNAVFEDSKIESRDKAPDGVLRVKAEADLRADLTPGDLVLCRRTSPLVSLCMRLIAAGIPAIVKGRNIGKQIADLADDLYKMPGFDYTQLHDAADRYQAEMFARYANRDNEEQLKEQLKDKLDALMSIYDAQPQIESLEGIKAYIDRLFSDDEQVGVVEMSTCHRAKGLEAESVFLLQADSMPMEWRNQAQWQLQQEMNLLYVALSRSTKSLTLVSNESIPWLPDELNWLEEDELTDEDVESKFAEVRAANIQALAASTPRS